MKQGGYRTKFTPAVENFCWNGSLGFDASRGSSNHNKLFFHFTVFNKDFWKDNKSKE